MTLLAVAAAGFAGAVGRYLVDLAVQHRTQSALPVGTLVVNVTGSAALGFVVGIGLYQGLADVSRAVVGTGFLGSYTTFSTFAYETIRLLEDGSRFEALANMAANTFLGLAAASTGLAIAAAL